MGVGANTTVKVYWDEKNRLVTDTNATLIKIHMSTYRTDGFGLEASKQERRKLFAFVFKATGFVPPPTNHSLLR